MPQQTAVEWFLMTMNIRGLLPNQELVECYKEAKQMEKEQTINAHNHGFTEGTCFGATTVYKYVTAEQYYKETYGKE
ncbi:MAG: hypothetical protein EB127_26720 [Alphaproteobacteria bacterium]|nr:hypothetical protein [Alphaproteobacteria bacterium]